MKVQTSIRDRFGEQIEINSLLKKHVDKTFLGAKHRRWHYESRLKELESFAVKVETGRVPDPSRLEDFLACTLVVPTTTEVQTAMELVRAHFSVVEARPADVTMTKKSANAFPFDDLRLYCRRENDGSRPPDRTDNITFEIQIKTFLQHAWGIATHDLSYKTDDVRWGKDRLVAHLKAAIEYAELAIHETGPLSQSEMLSLKHTPTTELAEIIEVLKSHWERLDLPENLRSLASTIRDLLELLDWKAGDLDQLLTARKQGTGSLPLNLSPYSVILEALIETQRADFVRGLKRGRTKIVITPELRLPPDFPPAGIQNKVVSL